MSTCDTLIRNARVYDGSGADPEVADVALLGDRIAAIEPALSMRACTVVEAEGLALAPGFIDAHTHDDLNVIADPVMLPKLSQGVTTVIVGNCGICAAPVTLHGNLPEPMGLLGSAKAFKYPSFSAYTAAIGAARPAVNVAALVGHTALRSNQMERLDRPADSAEIAGMRAQLEEALAAGALGLSTGLAYLSAYASTTEEVMELAQPLSAASAVYVTHLRTEGDGILDAMREAFAIGRQSRVPVLVSHLKCAGIDNWGRSSEVLQALDEARTAQPAGCDCYPYAASSSTLDLRQIDERVEIFITWSSPHPQMAGQPLSAIAEQWKIPQLEAARRLQPAGAIYHCIAEDDVRRILRHPATMIGSDGLPNDPMPHPRLWGTFPRVLGRYCRDEKVLPLAQAIHKMTGMPASRFAIAERGLVREGCFADLTLFDPENIIDTATFSKPRQTAEGIMAVWVNGVLSYQGHKPANQRGGRFLRRAKRPGCSEESARKTGREGRRDWE